MPRTMKPKAQAIRRIAPRRPGIPMVCRVSMCTSWCRSFHHRTAPRPPQEQSLDRHPDRDSDADPERRGRGKVGDGRAPTQRTPCLRCETMSATFEEHEGHHRWTLHDHRVTQLVVELGAVRLVTWTLNASLDI